MLRLRVGGLLLGGGLIHSWRGVLPAARAKLPERSECQQGDADGGRAEARVVLRRRRIATGEAVLRRGWSRPSGRPIPAPCPLRSGRDRSVASSGSAWLGSSAMRRCRTSADRRYTSAACRRWSNPATPPWSPVAAAVARSALSVALRPVCRRPALDGQLGDRGRAAGSLVASHGDGDPAVGPCVPVGMRRRAERDPGPLSVPEAPVRLEHLARYATTCGDEEGDRLAHGGRRRAHPCMHLERRRGPDVHLQLLSDRSGEGIIGVHVVLGAQRSQESRLGLVEEDGRQLIEEATRLAHLFPCEHHREPRRRVRDLDPRDGGRIGACELDQSCDGQATGHVRGAVRIRWRLVRVVVDRPDVRVDGREVDRLRILVVHHNRDGRGADRRSVRRGGGSRRLQAPGGPIGRS